MSRRRILALAVGAVVLVGLAVPFSRALDGEPAATGVLAEPTPAPELVGTSLTGEPVDLADLRGEVVLVNVWASWCAPCREELPLLVSTAEQHHDAGLRLLGIGTRDRRERARTFLEEVDPRGRMVNVDDPSGSHAVTWGSRGVPETFVVDRRGRVVARRSGEVSQAWLDDVVLPLVAP